MNADAVAALVEQALLTAEPNWAACASDDPTTRSAYAADQLRKFREEQLFPPALESVHLDENIARGMPAGWREVWFVTRGQPQSVFYEEETQLFGVAWGPIGKDSWYMDLGFRDTDPLDLRNA